MTQEAPAPIRTCSKCKVEKPASEFGSKTNSYCKPCQAAYMREYNARTREARNAYKREWENRNRERVREQRAARRAADPEYFRAASRVSMRKKSQRLRQAMLDRYGRSCACCGESIEVFLTLDHINGGGGAERDEVSHGVGGWKFYDWLEKQGWPDGYQTLCYNCNIAKHRLGVCPHQDNPSQPR